VRALELVDAWPVDHVAAGVADTAGPLATRGDRKRAYPWASVTKLVTALATLVAVEEGTVEIDEVAAHLAHASGLSPDDRSQQLAPPHARRIYSNAGFEVMAEMVGNRAGLPFEQYLAEAVMEPLEMTGARLDGSPAHGLVGTIDDLLRLAHELLVPTLISAETLALASRPAFPGLDGVLPGFGRQHPNDWGLGFEVRGQKSPHWTGRGNSPATFGHFGRSGTFLWVDPDAGLALGALTDREFGGWAAEAWPALSDAVLAEWRHRGQASPVSITK